MKGLALDLTTNDPDDGRPWDFTVRAKRDKAMQLVHTKGDSRFPGAYVVSDDYYIEMVDGKENGQYRITNSGIWVYVEYKRGTDGKIFRFTIDHDANPYGKAPCF